jgi:hypothetical protein
LRKKLFNLSGPLLARLPELKGCVRKPPGTVAISRSVIADHTDDDRVYHGHLTGGQIPADIVYGARKMKSKVSRKCRHILESVHSKRHRAQ